MFCEDVLKCFLSKMCPCLDLIFDLKLLCRAHRETRQEVKLGAVFIYYVQGVF